mgnify:CR=1 FL=1
MIGDKSLASYPVVLLETSAWFIEVLAMQKVYKYITKVKNIPNRRLPKWVWNIGCRVQKTDKEQFGWVLAINEMD